MLASNWKFNFDRMCLCPPKASPLYCGRRSETEAGNKRARGDSDCAQVVAGKLAAEGEVRRGPLEGAGQFTGNSPVYVVRGEAAARALPRQFIFTITCYLRPQSDSVGSKHEGKVGWRKDARTQIWRH